MDESKDYRIWLRQGRIHKLENKVYDVKKDPDGNVYLIEDKTIRTEVHQPLIIADGKEVTMPDISAIVEHDSNPNIAILFKNRNLYKYNQN